MDFKQFVHIVWRQAIYSQMERGGVYLLSRYCVRDGSRWRIDPYGRRGRLKGCEMEMKTLLAGWSNICPGCNIARKYPESYIGKKVRGHWKKGCLSHNAYVEVYGSDEPSPNKSRKASASKRNCD
jgi:hypothetical protein